MKTLGQGALLLLLKRNLSKNPKRGPKRGQRKKRGALSPCMAKNQDVLLKSSHKKKNKKHSKWMKSALNINNT